MGIVPLFATTWAAVYGRFTRAKRGLCSAASEWNDDEIGGNDLPPLVDLGHLGKEIGAFLAGHCWRNQYYRWYTTRRRTTRHIKLSNESGARDFENVLDACD